MEPIVKFLEWMQAASTLLVLLVIGCGGAIAIAGFFLRKWWLLPVGLLIGTLPFWSDALAGSSLENAIEERRNQVRAFPRIAMPPNYPRQFILEGDMSEKDMRWLIAAGYFDEIIASYLGQSTRLVAAGDREACRSAAMRLKDPDPRIRVDFDDPSFKPAAKLIETCMRPDPALRRRPDAVVMRLDRHVTLRVKDRLSAPQAVEIARRSPKGEFLAIYEENPTIPYPRSSWILLPEGYKYPCSGFADLQILINLLDTARDPKNKAVYERRAPTPSEYAPCMKSARPIAPDQPSLREGVEAL